MSEPNTIKVENAITQYLAAVPALSSINVTPFTSTEVAPEHPCIIVQCLKFNKRDDISRTANVTAALYYDSDDGDTEPALYKAAARALECALDDTAALQEVFNLDPLADPDPRTVTGLHLHYIDEHQTDSGTEDMTFEFGVGLTLHMEEVDS